MTAKRGRGREDDVIADLAVMSHMAAIHEVAAVADAGNAAAADRAGIHGHRLADGAALADLQPGRFTAIAERLRRRAKRGERIDRAAGADAGVPMTWTWAISLQFVPITTLRPIMQ